MPLRASELAVAREDEEKRADEDGENARHAHHYAECARVLLKRQRERNRDRDRDAR